MHYVKVFGSRWALIRCHMQAEFCCSFPRSYLEKRWDALQEERARAEAVKVPAALRSPLAAMDNQTVENRGYPNASAGIQERLPLQGLPKPKRWREASADSPTQPVRPPPPASPRTPTKALFAKHCPTFLLAPDSSLAAPDGVRRQLKAVYLASLLAAECAENEGIVRVPRPAATSGDQLGSNATGTEEPSPFASEDEKHQVCRLIARELSGFKRRPRAEVSGIGGSSPLAGSDATQWTRVAAVKTMGGSSAPPSSQLAASRPGRLAPNSPHRWPKPR